MNRPAFCEQCGDPFGGIVATATPNADECLRLACCSSISAPLSVGHAVAVKLKSAAKRV
jgi:hypothetical protein